LKKKGLFKRKIKIKTKMKSVDVPPVKRKEEKFSSLFAEYHEETIIEELK
jgi:hypothetical protein